MAQNTALDKVRLVGLDFMELRNAPIELRAVFEFYCFAVWAVLSARAILSVGTRCRFDTLTISSNAASMVQRRSATKTPSALSSIRASVRIESSIAA